MLENYNIAFPALVTPIQADYNHDASAKKAEKERTMPVYTYRCESCGIQFDHQQSFNADNLSVCPECDEESLHRVYRPVGIVFKGSGFYATDNRSPSGLKERNLKEGNDTAKETKTEKKDVEKKSPEPAKTESTKKTD